MSGQAVCPKCKAATGYAITFCTDCDPMECFYAKLPAGSIVLPAEQVEKLRDMRAEAQKLSETADLGPCLAYTASGMWQAYTNVLALLDGEAT